MFDETPVSSIAYRDLLVSHSFYGAVDIFVPYTDSSPVRIHQAPLEAILQMPAGKVFLPYQYFALRLCKNSLDVTVGGGDESQN